MSGCVGEKINKISVNVTGWNKLATLFRHAESEPFLVNVEVGGALQSVAAQAMVVRVLVRAVPNIQGIHIKKMTQH